MWHTSLFDDAMYAILWLVLYNWADAIGYFCNSTLIDKKSDYFLLGKPLCSGKKRARVFRLIDALKILSRFRIMV